MSRELKIITRAILVPCFSSRNGTEHSIPFRAVPRFSNNLTSIILIILTQGKCTVCTSSYSPFASNCLPDCICLTVSSQLDNWVGQAPLLKYYGGTGPPGPPCSYSYVWSSFFWPLISYLQLEEPRAHNYTNFNTSPHVACVLIRKPGICLIRIQSLATVNVIVQHTESSIQNCCVLNDTENIQARPPLLDYWGGRWPPGPPYSYSTAVLSQVVLVSDVKLS